MSAVPASFRLLQMRYQGVVDRCQHAHAPACPFMGVERWRVQPTFLNHARPLRHARSNGVTQMLCGQTVITRAIGAAATTTTTAISVVAAAADRMDQVAPTLPGLLGAALPVPSLLPASASAACGAAEGAAAAAAAACCWVSEGSGRLPIGPAQSRGQRGGVHDDIRGFPWSVTGDMGSSTIQVS